MRITHEKETTITKHIYSVVIRYTASLLQRFFSSLLNEVSKTALGIDLDQFIIRNKVKERNEEWYEYRKKDRQLISKRKISPENPNILEVPTGQIPDGKVVEYFVENGFNSNSIKYEIYYKNNKREGLAFEYYKSGKKRKVLTFVNDLVEGPFTMYYESGVTLSVGTVVSSNIEGNFVSFDESGVTRNIFQFKKNKPECSFTYDADGNMTEAELYMDSSEPVYKMTLPQDEIISVNYRDLIINYQKEIQAQIDAQKAFQKQQEIWKKKIEKEEEQYLSDVNNEMEKIAQRYRSDSNWEEIQAVIAEGSIYTEQFNREFLKLMAFKSIEKRHLALLISFERFKTLVDHGQLLVRLGDPNGQVLSVLYSDPNMPKDILVHELVYNRTKRDLEDAAIVEVGVDLNNY